MFANFYFQKYAHQPVFIEDTPHPGLNMIVVIPCFDEPDLIQSLDSLFQCERPACAVEIIVVINSSELASEHSKLQNTQSFIDAENWGNKNNCNSFKCFVIHIPDVIKKDAGVGFARKTGMDEALHRFNKLSKPNGIILSFDADALCDKNYFTEIENTFTKNPETTGASIYYEHPVTSNIYNEKIIDGIIQYELHLRYFNQALKFCEFPYAYHTIGSSFAVKAFVYAKQGGMNKKQAGEDFYFLHKVIPLGNFVEINSTRIVPSPRSSHRVPFGTGAALQKWITADDEYILTYNLQSFFDLKVFFSHSLSLYKSESEIILQAYQNLPDSLRVFISQIEFENSIQECSRNSSNHQNYKKRFYGWFDAFKIIRFLNTLHADYFQKMPAHIEAQKLLNIISPDSKFSNTISLLDFFRNFERGL